MQSEHTTIAMKKLGHVRRQSYGKIMPISTLLSNLIATQSAPTPNTSLSSANDSTNRLPFDAITMPLTVNERSDAMPTIIATTDFIPAATSSERPVANVQFLKCINYQRRESCPDEEEPIEIADATHDSEDDIDRLLANKRILLCKQQEEASSFSTDSSYDGDDTNRLQLLCGNLYDKGSNLSMIACQSSDMNGEPSNRITTDFPSDLSCDSDNAPFDDQSTASPLSDSQKFLSSMLGGEQTESPTDSVDWAGVHNDSGNISPLTEGNLKQFNDNQLKEKQKLNELLTNESMVNSAAVRLRLAARKLEMDLLLAEAAGKTPDEYIPPRELLMHVVRVGSFNSAPKFNNTDSQDDDCETPSSIKTAADLVNHCKLMRGDNQHELLARSFYKPPNDLVANDLAEGLRYLSLNSLSKTCSSPKSSPKNVRLFHWNILAQSLGQHNDNFVCCPDDALTWEARKFLIVQEIIQNDPDVICLQEVDHFKFLQSLLAPLNYEGVFYPKPDSPCLYYPGNNGPDGCALFFKTNKFELQTCGTQILKVWGAETNQVVIAANLRVIETGKEFCVCTTHLKARSGKLLALLRNEQGKDLMRYIESIAGTRPILMAGDFNAEPVEPVYNTIVNYKPYNLSSAYADLLASMQDENQSVDINEEDRVQHLMKNEPKFTTWKIREEGEYCHTIDYVFYSREGFKINNCLSFPKGREIGKNRTPSYRYPSDHFSLLCDFEIRDSDKD